MRRLPVAPAFERTDEERAVLHRLLDAARRAQDGEPKDARAAAHRPARARAAHRLHRVSRHARRDTRRDRRPSTHHDASWRSDATRAAAVGATRSRAAPPMCMIATDAGSEGLNLQGTCRLVVNLELPWNPDTPRAAHRPRRSHRSDAHGARHQPLRRRHGRAHGAGQSVAAHRSDPDERDRHRRVRHRAKRTRRRDPFPSETCTQTIDLGIEARAAAERIADTRRFDALGAAIFARRSCRSRSSKSPHASLISFFRIRLVTLAGRLIEDRLLPVRLPIDPPATPPRAERGTRPCANR